MAYCTRLRREVLRRPAGEVDVDLRLVQATDSASSCQGNDGWARMIGMSGKSTATSSRSIGLEYFRWMPPPPAHTGADRRLAGVEQRRQRVLGDGLVERVAMRSLGKNSCMLGWNLNPRTPYSVISRRASRRPRRRGRVDAGERDHDVASSRRELGDLLVRDLRRCARCPP